MNRRRQTARRSLLAITVASLVAAIAPVASTMAADPVDVTFNSTGAEQSWTVPAGVTTIHVVLVGGRGGSNAGSAGAADIVSGDLDVTAGNVLFLEVAGNGANATSTTGAAGGFNGGAPGGAGTVAGGAGGGGASDIRTIARAITGTLDSRLVVAAGGGGRGGGASGGAGGTAGWLGSNISSGDGTFYGGANGTIVAGGAGGGYLGTSTFAGASGTVGAGGSGGTDTSYGGGGGGGGYYGGGGGSGGGGLNTFAGAGGGGGASYRGSAQNSQIILDTNNTQPSITITYTPDGSPSDPPPDQQQVVFNATGAEQSFVVPSGVTSITVVALGGRGGAGINGAPGGSGARVQGVLAVTPGSTLYIQVGGNGANAGSAGAGSAGAGGFNGGGPGGGGFPLSGGGGGGASDIRTLSRTAPSTLGSRLLVAAGGGGGGGGDQGVGGGGGNAGSPGGGATSGAQGGGAGTATAGGGNGSLGLGGNGGGTGEPAAGGGGGAGLYGGGGGSAGGSGAGGGGGGSNFTGDATSPSTSIGSHTAASITIYYGEGTPPDPTPGADSGVVDATISMAESTICIELSTASVDFGTGQFGQVDVHGSPDIVVTNCGVSVQALFAHGTDAAAPGAAWTLVDSTATCADTLGLDEYHLRLLDAETLDDAWGLGTTNTLLQSIGVESTASYTPSIDTACPGSSGAGQQMSMQIVFTATEATP